MITAGFFVSRSWLPAAIALQIFTTCTTQEFVGQPHDQIEAFSLGQTSPRQNKTHYQSLQLDISLDDFEEYIERFLVDIFFQAIW